MKSLWSLLALLALPLAFAQADDKLHIYILLGQSNMSGRAKIEKEDLDIPKELLLLDNKQQWVPATHPFIQYTNVPNTADTRVIKAMGKSGLNFGLTFAREMLKAEPGVKIGLIVNSQGGSPIESWKKGAKKNYEKTLERILAVKDTGVIKGVLWHQGEANAAIGEKYLEPLQELIANLRADLKQPNLPFIAGQLAPLPAQKERLGPFNAALLKLPMLVEKTDVVQADDLSGKDIHFDSADTRTLGKRYAEAMLKVQKR